MNAISGISADFEAISASEAHRRLMKAGHAFRGAMIDKCSTIEKWAAALLRESGQNPKSHFLFGHKLKAVHGLASADRSRLKDTKKVLALLDRLQPLAELRADLAHSVQATAIACDGAGLVIFTPVHSASASWERIVLDESVMRRVLGELSCIANELGHQGLRKQS